MISGSSETLGYAAEALVLHGDWSGAEEQLREALEIVNTYGERIYLPQLLLTEGAIARARGQHVLGEVRVRIEGVSRSCQEQATDQRGRNRRRRGGKAERNSLAPHDSPHVQQTLYPRAHHMRSLHIADERGPIGRHVACSGPQCRAGRSTTKAPEPTRGHKERCGWSFWYSRDLRTLECNSR